MPPITFQNIGQLDSRGFNAGLIAGNKNLNDSFKGITDILKGFATEQANNNLTDQKAIISKLGLGQAQAAIDSSAFDRANLPGNTDANAVFTALQNKVAKNKTDFIANDAFTTKKNAIHNRPLLADLASQLNKKDVSIVGVHKSNSYINLTPEAKSRFDTTLSKSIFDKKQELLNQVHKTEKPLVDQAVYQLETASLDKRKAMMKDFVGSGKFSSEALLALNTALTGSYAKDQLLTNSKQKSTDLAAENKFKPFLSDTISGVGKRESDKLDKQKSDIAAKYKNISTVENKDGSISLSYGKNVPPELKQSISNTLATSAENLRKGRTDRQTSSTNEFIANSGVSIKEATILRNDAVRQITEANKLSPAVSAEVKNKLSTDINVTDATNKLSAAKTELNLFEKAAKDNSTTPASSDAGLSQIKSMLDSTKNLSSSVKAKIIDYISGAKSFTDSNGNIITDATGNPLLPTAAQVNLAISASFHDGLFSSGNDVFSSVNLNKNITQLLIGTGSRAAFVKTRRLALNKSIGDASTNLIGITSKATSKAIRDSRTALGIKSDNPSASNIFRNAKTISSEVGIKNFNIAAAKQVKKDKAKIAKIISARDNKSRVSTINDIPNTILNKVGSSKNAKKLIKVIKSRSADIYNSSFKEATREITNSIKKVNSSIGLSIKSNINKIFVNKIVNDYKDKLRAITTHSGTGRIGVYDFKAVNTLGKKFEKNVFIFLEKNKKQQQDLINKRNKTNNQIRDALIGK